MKKFYNSPVVEITVFDVEDIITASAITTQGLTEDQFETELKNNSVAVENVVTWSDSYEW